MRQRYAMETQIPSVSESVASTQRNSSVPGRSVCLCVQLGAVRTDAEPQLELMYGHLQGVTYNAGDVTIENDSVDTLVGRVGVAAGYKFLEDKGNAYIKASLLHDFKGEVKTQATSGNETDGGVTRDFGGTWGEFAIVGTYKATKNLNFYGELMCSTKNAGVRTKWQGSVGVRYTF